MVFGTKLKKTLLELQKKNLPIQTLASSYDKISTNYTQNFNISLETYYYDLIKRLGEIKNKKILDLGCGTAWLGKVLFTNSAPLFYHGIDISTNMIHASRKNLSEFSQIKIEHGDFQENLKKIPKESYDIVFLTWSLKYNTIHTLIEQALRVLKTGGKLAILTETNSSTDVINSALKELTTINGNNSSIIFSLPKTYLPHDSHQLTDLLNKTGFSQTIVWEKSRINSFSSASDFIIWARQNGLLIAWDETLIQTATSGEYSINQKFLGAVARK